MDVSTPCVVSVSEGVNSGSGLILPQLNHKQSLCSNSGTIDDNVVSELGNALDGILHVQDVQELVSDHVDLNEETSSEDMESSCEGFEVHEVSPLTAKTNKVLCKCATFPCSTQSLSHVSVVGGDEITGIAMSGQCSLNPANAACARSMSLPTSSELLSAIKGSRQKQGRPLTKLSVTWAPDVYDPPTTSLSHTVKGHSQQRSRSSKKYSKHKHKGKSSRGSSSDKKHYSSSDKKHYRRYTGSSHSRSPASSGIGNSEPCYKPPATDDIGNSDLCCNSSTSNDARKSELRPKSLAMNDRFLVADFPQSSVDLADFVTAQESKCGSSFLRASINKVHISVAEAT